jgi:hypothetical protein
LRRKFSPVQAFNKPVFINNPYYKKRGGKETEKESFAGICAEDVIHYQDLARQYAKKVVASHLFHVDAFG